MSKRVKVNSAKVRGLRLARGWDPQRLANEAEVSRRTIGSVESDACPGVSPYTLMNVAKALNVKPEEIAECEIPRPTSEKRIRIIIEVPIPFQEFDEASNGEQLIDAMRAWLQLPMKTIEIKGTRGVHSQIKHQQSTSDLHNNDLMNRDTVSRATLLCTQLFLELDEIDFCELDSTFHRIKDQEAVAKNCEELYTQLAQSLIDKGDDLADTYNLEVYQRATSERSRAQHLFMESILSFVTYMAAGVHEYKRVVDSRGQLLIGLTSH